MHELVLGQSFTDALCNYAQAYKKNEKATLDDIFSQLGVSNQVISYWRNNQFSAALTLKYSTLIAAANLFKLSAEQAEELANKAGLSLLWRKAEHNAECAEELCPFGVKQTQAIGFIEDLDSLLPPYFGSFTALSTAALMTDRTLRYIKAGRHLSKSSILSLLIAMGLDLENIQDILKKSGIILSQSIPSDMVVMWILNNEKQKLDSGRRICEINELLSYMELPLLKTR